MFITLLSNTINANSLLSIKKLVLISWIFKEIAPETFLLNYIAFDKALVMKGLSFPGPKLFLLVHKPVSFKILSWI